jgi:hypothetical protein
MIVLDTNVLSEPSRPYPNPGVLSWLDTYGWDEAFLCTPVLAELRYGVERLPAGGRRNRLQEWVQKIEHEIFVDRILLLDREAAHQFGQIVASRDRIGRPIGSMDALIAAIALVHRAALATRDISDFADVGLELVDPFAVP